MTVRAKFRCTEVTDRWSGAPGQPTMKQVVLDAVMPAYKDGKPDPEHPNTQFFSASPSGRLTLGVLNPAAAEQFIVGAEYHLDFTRVG
jgi:hypothetical protein